MKQAQAMQAKLQEAQADMERTEVEGSSGGGLVKVRLTAKGDMKGLS
ncbi:YbaB/EbfC family nucleoid-associated protein, partial [Klebsiella pneumoniae]